MASNGIGIDVEPDLRTALRALKQLEPELEKSLRKEMRAASAPLVAAGRGAVPAAPLSQWARYGSYRWDPKQVRRDINVTQRTNPRRGDYAPTFATLSYRMKSGLGPAFDMAGKFQNGRFTQLLTARYGDRSRLMVPTFLQESRRVVEGISEAVEATVAELNRRLR